MIGWILLGILALIGVDIWSLFYLTATIGGWATLGVVILGFLVGSVVLRFAAPYSGMRIIRRLSNGEPPGRELVDAGFLFAGGLLFFLPGLASYALAVLFILPGLRAIPRTVFLALFQRKVVYTHYGPPATPPSAPDASPASVDGKVVDVDFRRDL
ncbi:MAG: FxsA family protein [Thermoplasmatota archaeon]